MTTTTDPVARMYAAGFLEALYAELPAGVWLAFTAAEPDRFKDGRHRFFPAGELDAAADWCARWAPPWNVYVRCMGMSSEPERGRRGDDALSVALVGLWADIDYVAPGHKTNPDRRPLPPTPEDAARILAAVPVPPTLVLHTGGGLQAWWLLDRPEVAGDDTERARLADVVKRWGDSIAGYAWRANGGDPDDPDGTRRNGWHADRVNDASRVLRVPGTWRTKRHQGQLTEPIRVKLAATGEPSPGLAYARPWNPSPRYRLAELEAVMVPEPPAFTTPKPPPAPSSSSTRTPRTTDTYGPADAFAELEWSAILAPAGWTHEGTETVNGHPAELWRRPGGESAYSLKALHSPPVAVVWSDNAGLPVGKGHRLTKFRLWCALNNLDPAEASRLVRDEWRTRRKGVRA
jgi:hypothetical protein